MSISIPIQVDRSQLQAAIKDIAEVKTALSSITGLQLPGMETTQRTPAMQTAIEQMHNLQGNNRTLPPDMTRHLSGMDSVTRRIATNLQTWQTAAKRARDELKQVTADLKGLESASHDPKLQPSTRGVMLDEIQQLTSRRSELERTAANAEKRANDYKQRLPENYNQMLDHAHVTVGSRQDQQQQRALASSLKKIMGYGLVAAGGFGLGSFLSQSRSDYRQSIEHEGPLFARGIKGSRDRAVTAVGIGMTPLEYYGLEERLSASTGLNGKTDIGKHAMLTAAFAKSQGIGTDQAVNLRENVYHATGNAGSLPSATLLAISRSTADSLDKSKMAELLNQINKSMGITAHSLGGAAMSKEQLSASMAIALEGLKLGGEKGVFAKSGEFTNVMQNGLQGAGTGAGDIRLFQAMGGFNGPMTWEKIHEINMIKQGGFMERPELLQQILGGLSGSKEAKAGQLETMFPQWNLGAKGSKTLIEMQDSGFFKKLSSSKKNMLDELDKQAKSGDKQAAQWLAEIKANPALGRQSTEATKDAVKIEAGEKLSKLFEPLEMSAAKMAGALADGDWKKSFGILGTAAGEMGPAAKLMVTAAGLYAAGGALGFLGGAMNLGKGALPAGAAGATGMLSKIAPWLFNPVTGGIALGAGTLGAIGWAGADNDKNLKRVQSEKELRDRLSQLEVQGNPNGPEGKRIKAELESRSGIAPSRFNGVTTIPSADGTVTHRKGSRAWANHNPGNIEDGAFAKAQGSIGSDGRFAVFPSYAAGRKAKENLLFGDRYKNLSATAAIAKWAPASENPNLPQYQQSVLRAIGGNNIKLKDFTQDQRKSYMDAMERFEGFQPGTEWSTRKTPTISQRKPWEVDAGRYTVPTHTMDNPIMQVEKPRQAKTETGATGTTIPQATSNPLVDPKLLDVLLQIASNTKPQQLPLTAVAPSPQQ